MIFKVIIGLVIFVICFLAFKSFNTRHTIVKSSTERQLLLPCPDKPNCVLSTSSIKREMIKPFELINNDSAYSWQQLKRAIENKNGHIMVDDGHYLHAVFTSSLFRFKDDVEAMLTPEHIDIRSASRAGTSDMGKNRQRIIDIRTHYNSLKQ